MKNSPDKVLTFHDTHEAIVSRKLFDTVQRHFAGRKRPDQQGEMDKYAGYLFCGECGQKLYLHRSTFLKRDLKLGNKVSLAMSILSLTNICANRGAASADLVGYDGFTFFL